MSSNEIPTREIARRVFTQESNDAGHMFKGSDNERTPIYLLLPTGKSANHAFLVGTLAEKEDVGENSEYWRGHIVNPTRMFFTYAGQYQPETASTLRDLDAPAYITVINKSRTYETDDGSINVSIHPESITEVGATTCDHWMTKTADKTLDRIAASNEEGDECARMAHEHYDLDPEGYKRAAIAALENLEQTDGLNA